MVKQWTDEEIANALRNGNKAALKHVFDSCYGSLCQYASTIVKDQAEAEDIVQAMFIKLWEKREELTVNQSARSYLFKSVYHQCINALEHRTVKLKHAAHAKTEMVSESLPDVFPEELDVQVKSAINGLPEQCRRIFIMSRYEEMKHAEIAAQLNLSVNTIENQISKALKLLRAALKNEIG